MTTATRFNRFLANLTLTADQQADAKTKYDGVAGKLHSHYYSTAFTGGTRKLIGSYGKGTAVRPPRDVDILFLLPKSVYDQYNTYTGNAQSQLPQAVRKVLLEKYPATAIRGDGQVVVVPFPNGHPVELLPGWRTTKDQFLVPNTHDGGHWPLLGDEARSSDNLSRLGTHPTRRQPGDRRPDGQAWLRPARRDTGDLRRCPAAPYRLRHLPLCRRPALLVLPPAFGHPTCAGSGGVAFQRRRR